MKALLKCFALCLLSCALVACAKTREAGNSSETHFLATCETEACGPGLHCVCGACTEACEENASCAEHGSSARCEATQISACSTASVCDVACAGDEDCEALGGEHACSEGRCRAPQVVVASGDGDGMATVTRTTPAR
jgi:hypothetical protein